MSGQAEGDAFQFEVLDAEMRRSAGALDLPYWVYRVCARTTLPAYQRSEMEVLRRYSDFEWLRSQLCETNPYCIVPPIPEKDFHGTFEKIKMVDLSCTTPLRDYRQRALKNFLCRVGAHPQLRSTRLLRDFLEMGESEWERKMKADAKGVERSFATAIGENVNHALALQWGAGSGALDPGVGYTQAVRGTTDPQVWEGTRVYIQQLEDSIKMLRERLQMLVDRRRNTSNALHDFAEAFERVGEVEKGVESTTLSNALIAVGKHSEQLSSIYINQANDERKQVVEVLQYYTGMCAAVRETLKRLQVATYQVEVLRGRVEDLRIQRERAVNRNGQTERLAKLDAEIARTRERWEESKGNLEAGERIFKEEIRHFHHHKQHDIKTVLKAFAKLQLNYAAKIKEDWEKLRPTVEQVQLNNDSSVQEDAPSKN